LNATPNRAGHERQAPQQTRERAALARHQYRDPGDHPDEGCRARTHLGPVGGLVVALAFFRSATAPGDFARRREWNLISILGFISVLLTGGIGLLQLDPKWIAVKEAAVPGIIGIAVLLSLRTRFPIVRTFLYNDKIIRMDEVDAALARNAATSAAFEQTLVKASWMLAALFLRFLGPEFRPRQADREEHSRVRPRSTRNSGA
jgi:hypothetical protein